jgi:hypothetical protein
MRFLTAVRHASAVFAAVTFASLIACGSSKIAEDGGIIGGGFEPPPIVGGGCDSSLPVEKGGCRITPEYGVFVAATGNDAAPGTPEEPLRTLSAAVALVKSGKGKGKGNVYVCGGTYDDLVDVTNVGDGVALHGGFACTGGPWKYTGADTTLAPTKPGIPIRVTGSPFVLEDLKVVARDGAAAGDSSIAMFVASSGGITLRRAALVAGAGVAGAPGSSDTTDLGTAPAGNWGTLQKAGDAKSCQCGSATTTGGQGGDHTRSPTPGLPTIPGAPAGSGGVGTDIFAGGADGAPGRSGKPGAAAAVVGSISAQGWSGTAGGAGEPGGVGQGGGGGLGNSDVHAGGGACGGCGGKGGGGGGAGGSSIGLVSFASTVRLVKTTIVTGNGGAGAAGGAGQPGQRGGPRSGGTVLGVNDPRPAGGGGGNGGDGGPGGPGAGGCSFGIAHTGAAPEIDADSKITTGSAGAGGDPSSATPGIAGAAAPVRAFP